MHQWVALTTRTGETVQNPTNEQLRSSLEELFAFSDDEHPDAWIECGSEDKPLHELSVFFSGYAIYTVYSDPDMTEELESRRLKALGVEAALGLWELLINERYSELL